MTEKQNAQDSYINVKKGKYAYSGSSLLRLSLPG